MFKQIDPSPSSAFGRLRRAAGLCAAAAMLTGAAEPDYPADTLFLLVASWCAPCRGELERLPSIVAAAGPITVRVVPYDDRAATAAMLRPLDPARVLRSRRIVAALSRETGGLPFSLMTDASGRACATHHRPLDGTAVRAMRMRCAARS